MKHILTTTLMIFGFIHQVYSQKTDKQTLNNLVKVWGQISEHTPEHRGKEGLVLLKLNQNNTFLAYENTDYGASVLQTGTWKLKKKNITFIVTKTTLEREGKEYFMRGKILELDKGKITYEILDLEETKFIIKAKKSDKTLIFKPSKYVYFPKSYK